MLNVTIQMELTTWFDFSPFGTLSVELTISAF